jgi:hypothetical protein
VASRKSLMCNGRIGLEKTKGACLWSRVAPASTDSDQWTWGNNKRCVSMMATVKRILVESTKFRDDPGKESAWCGVLMTCAMMCGADSNVAKVREYTQSNSCSDRHDSGQMEDTA